MQKLKEQPVLAKEDYEIIMTELKTGTGRTTFNRHDAEELEAELKKARLVKRDKVPGDVVRLNSTVTIRDEKDKKEMQLMVVTPEKADIKQRRISIMSPIGTALIGFRKGQQVKWRVPAGLKTFTIVDVTNPFQ